MSASLVSRTFLRQHNRQILVRRSPFRLASTTEKASEAASSAASKTKETATSIQSKASQGLSRVTSSAGPAIANAASGAGNALRRIGGPIGRLVGAVESAYPITIYYSKVAFELSKLVFNGQRMAPPPLSTFSSYLGSVVNVIRHPSSLLRSAPEATSPESVLSRLRSFNRASLVAGGVVVAELLGFFSIGEMLGRLKLIGYYGKVHDEH